MRINELRSARDTIRHGDLRHRQDFWAVLNDMGWKTSPVQGAYSNVWLHDDFNYILKLYEPRDAGYVRFLTLVLQNRDNPHFPMLRGRPVAVTPRVMAIRMEKLDPMPEARFHEMKPWLDVFGGIRMWRRFLPQHPDAERFLEQWPRFGDALDLLNGSFAGSTGIDFDWHSGNIMQRGEVPVIIDPFKPWPRFRPA